MALKQEWGEIRGLDQAVRYFGRYPDAVAEEIYNTLRYCGDVIRGRVMQDSWSDAAGNPIHDRTGRARRSIRAKVFRNAKTGQVRLDVFPTRSYVYMLGWGWRERRIRYDIVTRRRVQTSLGRRRTTFSQTRYRRHHLDPHPFAPRIRAQMEGWVNEALIGALKRGAKEAERGS